jgi:hypothetical protein
MIKISITVGTGAKGIVSPQLETERVDPTEEELSYFKMIRPEIEIANALKYVEAEMKKNSPPVT